MYVAILDRNRSTQNLRLACDVNNFSLKKYNLSGVKMPFLVLSFHDVLCCLEFFLGN